MPELPQALQNILDLETRQDPSKRQPKIVFAGDSWEDGMPYLLVTEDQIVVMGDKRHTINTNPDFGTLISGKMSLSAMPQEISFAGGYWRVNPQVLSTIPSTTPTPVPWLVKAIPELLEGKNAIKSALDFMKSQSDLV